MPLIDLCIYLTFFCFILVLFFFLYLCARWSSFVGGVESSSSSSATEDAEAAVRMHLVRAMKNPFWEREETKEKVALMMASRSERATFVHDVDGGHWLHAERPKELYKVMVEGGLSDDLRQ